MSLPLRVQNWPASAIASSFNVPEPSNPLGACLATMKVPAPAWTTPAFVTPPIEAHPAKAQNAGNTTQ
jgi:hypothetical protein